MRVGEQQCAVLVRGSNVGELTPRGQEAVRCVLKAHCSNLKTLSSVPAQYMVIGKGYMVYHALCTQYILVHWCNVQEAWSSVSHTRPAATAAAAAADARDTKCHHSHGSVQHGFCSLPVLKCKLFHTFPFPSTFQLENSFA